MKRYDKYKNSGEEWLGEIPEHWELTRLGSYFRERKTKVSDKDYAPLSVTKNGILPQLDNAAKTNDGDNRKLVKKGDFVINSRSDRKGSSGIANESGSVSLINIVMKPLNINPIFCNYLLKSTAFIEENYRIGHGIVADLWTTRYDEMKNIKIGVPKIKEQSAIAHFLDDKTSKVDQAIIIKQKQIELLKERRQILIHKAVTRGLDENVKLKDSGVEWIGEIPEHWGVMKIKDILVEKKKTTNPSLNCGSISYGKVVYKNDDSILESTKKSYQVLLKGEFLINPLNLNYDLKSLRIALSDKDVVVSSGYLILNTKIEINKFFLNWILHRFDIDYMKILGAGVRQTLNYYDISRCELVIPPIHEQEKISEYIEASNKKIDLAISLKEQEIEKLKEYKMSLIDAVVTGKVKVC